MDGSGGTTTVAEVRAAVRDERLNRPDWRPVIRHLSAWSGLLAFFGFVATVSSSIPLRLVAGLAQVGVFIGVAGVVHDATHRNLFGSTVANRLVVFVGGVIGLLPGATYRSMHLAHHAHPLEPEDPQVESIWFTSRWRYLSVLAIAGPFLLLQHWWVAIRTVVGWPPPHVRRAERRAIAVQAVLQVGIYAVVVRAIGGGATWLVTGWLVAAIAVHLFVSGPLLLYEHYGADPSADPLATTRTIVGGPVLRWCFWNTNLHTAHHVVPNVPYHRLAAIDDMLAPSMHHRHRSLASFHRWVWQTAGPLSVGAVALPENGCSRPLTDQSGP